jgi:leucyl aminopeptidase
MRTQLQSVSEYQHSDHLIVLSDRHNLKWAANLLSSEDIQALELAMNNEVFSILFTQGPRFIFVEIMPDKKDESWRKEQVRKAGANLITVLRRHKIAQAVLLNHANTNYSQQYAEGLVLGNYQFIKYFKDPSKLETSFKTLQVLNTALSPKQLEELSHELEAICWARDMINEPLSYLTAPQLAKEFEALGQAAGFSTEVLGKGQIEALKMGGLLAVNRGSQTPPTYTIMEWKPENAKNSQPIVLIGKGLVYDTGGVSLKPTPNSMDMMKCDMAGGAIVGSLLYLAAKNKLPLHIVGLVPATDNRPGEDAYVPGDIIQMMSGAFVEVLNTDAEGRMILADALHHAKSFQPSLVLDFATLTGAAAMATGTQAAVYYCHGDEQLRQQVQKSAFEVFERVVEFPLWDDYADLLKSDVADMKNIGGPYAGSITAAKFLQYFTEYNWLHFDIAGVAFLMKEEGYRTKGGNPFGIRLVYDFLKQQAEG